MIFKKLNGQTFNLNDADIKTVSIDISSPNVLSKYATVDGMRGAIDVGSTYGPREIECKFLMESSMRETFGLLRDEIFAMLGSTEPFYLIEERQQGRQWLVRLDEPFFINQDNVYGVFEVVFNAFEGVAESVSSTQVIESRGVELGSLWGFGMGLETVDDSELRYTHHSTNFRVFNAGNVDVHPFETMLKIEIKNISGATGIFTLTNKANGSRIRIKRTPVSTETWLFDGPVIKRNSLMSAKDTTKEFIYLSPGWNTFAITGASSAVVSFDFKYLYM